MDTHKKVESVTAEAAVIRAVLPRHPVKRLARLLSVPIATAHDWTYRRLSSARRRDLARALLAELDRQETERRALRRRLAEWARDA